MGQAVSSARFDGLEAAPLHPARAAGPRRGSLSSASGERWGSGAYRAAATAVLALTLGAVAANVVWFARYGVGPLELLRIAGPLWLALTLGMVAFGAAAWLLARVLGRGSPKR